MAEEQIALPFRLLKGEAINKEEKRQPNADLIGRSFFDQSVTMTVISLYPANAKQVIVQRDADGKSWSVPAGLIRLIVGHKKKRRAA